MVWTAMGAVDVPEGSEIEAAWRACEDCYAATCRGDAADPVDAASNYRDEPWCPGHCQRFWELATPDPGEG